MRLLETVSAKLQLSMGVMREADCDKDHQMIRFTIAFTIKRKGVAEQMLSLI